ncbi:MAG: hypothetical protein O3C40_06170 [Planctomycetota bacterium]|nr:hypothetical protein [Planctomycetota bacterium]
MKRIALSFATVAVLVACTSSAQASDLTEILRIAFGTNHQSYRHAAQHAHVDHHVDLQAREIEREYVHQAAHYQPLTTRQHVRLHNDLDHSSYHDAVEHETAHATRAYSPRYIQSYRSVPSGYGTPYRSSAYGAYPYRSQVGRSPYGRY